MNPLIDQVFDEVRSSWRFRWLALGVAVALALAAWLVIFALPDRYEAMASVFVDTRTPLKPALQSLALEQDVEGELNFVRQSLLAGPELERVAHEGGILPATAINPRLQERLINDMRWRIDISVRSANGKEDERRTAGSIYTIVYQDANRERALRVVQVLLDTFVEKTLGGKREGSESAQQFLQTQIQEYEKKLHTAEERLAEFKSLHIGLMPNEQGGYFAQLQHEEDTVTTLKTKLAQAQSRRAALQRQLHGDVAVAAAAPTQSNRPGGGLDTLSRIDEAQARLDELLLRFTDQHPDVIAARQTLKDLKERREVEIEGLKQGDASAAASSRASTNPVYQSVQLGLNQVDVDIADLNTELAEHQTKVAELRRFLNTAPQVEAQFQQLNRDYDVNKQQYTALLANMQKVRIGERADSAGSVRFEIVQPPDAGLRPVWPRRTLLLAAALGAALAAGGALAYGLHYLRPVVTSGPAISKALGVPVLGLVGVAFPQRARKARRRDILRLSLGCACLVVAFLAAVFLSMQGYRLSVITLKHMVGL